MHHRRVRSSHSRTTRTSAETASTTSVIPTRTAPSTATTPAPSGRGPARRRADTLRGGRRLDPDGDCRSFDQRHRPAGRRPPRARTDTCDLDFDHAHRHDRCRQHLAALDGTDAGGRAFECTLAAEDVLTMADLMIANCGVGQTGGALRSTGGAIDMTNMTFEDNTAQGDVALHMEGTNLQLTDCVFRRNLAEDGGAISMRSGGALTISGGLFEANEASIDTGSSDFNYGGAINLTSTSGPWTSTAARPREPPEHEDGGGGHLSVARRVDHHHTARSDNSTEDAGGVLFRTSPRAPSPSPTRHSPETRAETLKRAPGTAMETPVAPVAQSR